MKGHKEIRSIKFAYTVNISLSFLPPCYPEEIILPELLKLLKSLGLNPKGVQYLLVDRTALLSFIVFPQQIDIIYEAFGREAYSLRSLLSIPIFAPLLIPLLPLTDPYILPPAVSYFTQPSLVFVFEKVPNFIQQEELIAALSALGALDNFSLLGKLAVVSFITPLTDIPFGDSETLVTRLFPSKIKEKKKKNNEEGSNQVLKKYF